MTDKLPLLVEHLRGMYAMHVLAMGRGSGALAALAESPATAKEVAARASLDEHNTDLWLRAMTAAGHAHHDDGVFSIDAETAMVLGPAFPVDFGAALDFVQATFADPIRQATTAMATGRGVPSSKYAEFGTAAGGLNSRLYQMALVDEWISAAPDLRSRLETGGRIADLACGNGDAAATMATAFPLSEVRGYDPGAPEGAHGDLPNLEIVREVADGIPVDDRFDLVTCLDALHHLGDGQAVARQVRDALVDGGVFLVAENALSGEVDADGADPFSLIAHASGLMYCMQENLANGGAGSTPSFGLGWVEDALGGAGFSSVTHLDSDTGFRVFLAVR